MKIEDITQLINYIERKYDVDQWEINGIPLWPFIRIENYYLMSLALLSSDSKIGSNNKAYIKQILFSKYHQFAASLKDKKNSNTSKCDVVFLSDGVSFTQINGKWFEKFCDPLASEFQKKGFATCRFDLAHSYLTPRYSPSKYIQSQVDNVIIKSLVSSKLNPPKFKKEIWSDFDAFLKDEKVINQLKQMPSKQSLRNKVAKLLALKKYYTSLLKKCNPKQAFVVSYYGDQQMAFIIACKELGIMVFDLQHGVQGAHHLAYGSWKKTPQKGYVCIPDYFLVWSEKEKIAIYSSCSLTFTQKHQPLVSGNLFAEFWKNEEEQIVVDFDHKISTCIQQKSQPVILLTLSPYTESLMESTWEVVKETQGKYNWWIRLHPAMLNQKQELIELLKKKEIHQYNLNESTNFPLYSLLRKVDAHVTVQSSTLIEASYFGVPSVITSEYGKELYSNYIDDSSAKVAIESKEIQKAIEIVLTYNLPLNLLKRENFMEFIFNENEL